MRRILILANVGLLLLVLLTSTACSSASGYGTVASPGSSAGTSDSAGPDSTGSGAQATGPDATSPEPPTQLSTQPTPEPSTYQSPLKAGQVDDNASFNDYLNYLLTYGGPAAHPIDVTARLFLRVLDSNQ